MKKKPFVIAYFVILFAIMCSFLAGSIQEPQIWMQIMTADQLSETQDNVVFVWVRDPDSNKSFDDNYRIELNWLVKEDISKHLLDRYQSLSQLNLTETDREFGEKIEFDATMARAATLISPASRNCDEYENCYPEDKGLYKLFLFEGNQRVAPNGRTAATIPAGWNKYRDVLSALRVCLWSELPNESARERSCTRIPFEAMTSHANLEVVADENAMADNLYTTWEPATHIYDVPSDIQIVTINEDGPYRGPIKVEQIYGQPAKFPKTLQTDGIARMSLEIPMGGAGVDLKFTAGEKEFFASITPGMKPLSASVSQMFVTPNSNPSLSVVPFGTMPTITIDYFDDEAWIDRQTIAPEDVPLAVLAPKYKFSEKPALLYARINNSDVGSSDNSQTIALIASAKDMSIEEQAQFAVHELKRKTAHSAIVSLEKLIESDRTNIHLMQEIRDYALGQIASSHAPEIAQRVRTDEEDTARFEAEKRARKSKSNIILLAWFGVGILGSLVLCISANRRKKERWAMLAENPELATEFKSGNDGLGLPVLGLVILFIGFMVSLYYMMQII